MKAGWIVPFIIFGGRAAILRCGHERPAPKAPSQSMAGVGGVFRAHHVLRRWSVPDHGAPAAYNGGSGVIAVVGRHRRSDWCRSGLRRPYSSQQGRAGPFMGFTVTAALIASLAIDHFGWFRMDHHPLNVWRALGGLLLVGGVTLVAKF